LNQTTYLTQELSTAVAAVRTAAEVCRAVQKNLVNAKTREKKDRSPVTVADFASQAVVCGILAKAMPDIPVVGEEDSAELQTEENAARRQAVVENVNSVIKAPADEQTVLGWIDRGGAVPDATTPRFWTLDPIDGTKGFLRGEQYAIALALVEQGKVVLGVMGCPNLSMPGQDEPGVLMIAVAGHGTRALPLNCDMDQAKPVYVSTIDDSSDARFCESVESGHSDQGQSARIAQILGITQEPYRIDSQCKYAAVARGDASIYLRLPTSSEYHEKIWDHGAGMIAVEAAGGTVTDITGKPLDFSQGRQLENNRGIIASNGKFHNQVVAAVQQVIQA
jgi:HAL2 family 3'(2'),5'-bisphosphate nucleotidase